ncbi:MAG: hypothetical protein JKP92_02190 [Alphaproteobacteria bacterium]|nr:hypothetical protein [Alphaproteobacteria bacterium]
MKYHDMKYHIGAAALVLLGGMQAASAQGPRIGYIGIESVDPGERTVTFTTGFTRDVFCREGLAGLDPFVRTKRPPAFAKKMVELWEQANARAQNPPKDPAGVAKVRDHLRDVHGLTDGHEATLREMCPGTPQ